MKQYIDKSALVAEIEKYISNYKGILNKIDKSSDDWVEATLMTESKIDMCKIILSFIDTLEAKENDLVEELDYNDYIAFFKEHPEYNNGDWGFDETWIFGQYCYKLGLKVAQKGG